MAVAPLAKLSSKTAGRLCKSGTLIPHEDYVTFVGYTLHGERAYRSWPDIAVCGSPAACPGNSASIER
eukprot:scaffold43322_cov28-Tisochrysis_lutea.AAC.10